jgi:hypothetical protein
MAQPKPKRNDVKSHQRRAAGSGSSKLWRSIRTQHGPRVRDLVDDFVKGAEALTLRDVLYLELAAHEEMRDHADEEPREAADLAGKMLQSRKHMRMILQDLGDTGDVDTQPVRVPDGLRVLPPPDEGDELL